MSKKHSLWSVGQITLASYLAGPAGGCYLLGRNYKKLGQPTSSKKSYLLSIVGTLLLASLLLLLPEETFSHIPKMIIPITYTSAITAIATYQKKSIKEMRANGEKRHSYWWCFLVAISILIIQAFVFLSLFYISGL